MKRIALVGDGRMAAEAFRVVAEHETVHAVAWLHHPMDPQRFPRSVISEASEDIWVSAVDNVNDPAVLDRLQDLAPDLVLSVNNFDIIRKCLLSIPADGVVNFHNGPVPEYRGVNIPSWAIINGERQHGVTWHFVDEGIDTGDVVKEAAFPIDASETAISLIFRCIDEGLELLPSLLDEYAGNTLERNPQTGEGRYYSSSDSPNGGKVDFSRPAAEIDRLVRGLTFHPFPNTFVEPHFLAGNDPVIIGSVSVAAGSESGAAGNDNPGQIREIARDSVFVQCANAVVQLEALTDREGQPLDTASLKGRFALAPGMQV